MFQKLCYFFAPSVVFLLLSLMTSPSEISIPLLYENESPIQISVGSVNKTANSDGVIINANQAANFNHINQLFVDYIFVILLAIFFVIVIDYRNFKSVILPHPWYIILKYSSRFSLSGWKVSNLLYKCKLHFQF